MWVTGSRQFRDFDDYLLAGSDYTAMKHAGELPLVITNGGKEYTIVPQHAQHLIDQASAMFLRIRTTDLLMEVDGWTGFTRHFTNLKSGQPSKDKQLLLTAILAMESIWD